MTMDRPAIEANAGAAIPRKPFGNQVAEKFRGNVIVSPKGTGIQCLSAACVVTLIECEMFKQSSSRLAARPAPFRYFYYILSSFRLTSYRSWKAKGEPNPFVKKTYRHNCTEKIDFVDIFDDVLTPRK